MSLLELRDRLQQSLSGSYVLERELGGGGMSRLFLASESRFRRQVVIKVLPPELTEGLSAERFEREIALAAGLQQANIVPVISAGDVAGLPWYSMPYVEGESLRARIVKGPTSVNESLRILGDIARALTYAHEHGIVHRDIKPENVLLSGGTAVVADFGIAKAVSASRTKAPGETLTRVGTSIGTPAYMAPEQAAGDPATDHRADIYAWGVIAYELLSGRHPFAGKTSPQQLLSAHMTEVPATLRPTDAANNVIAPEIRDVVMRSLAKDPAARPQTASALLAVIDGSGSSRLPLTNRFRKVTAALVAIAIFAIAIVAALVFVARRTPASAEHMIAVIPLVVSASDTTNDLLPDAITDELTSALAQSRAPGLSVINRGSADEFRGRHIDARDVGTRLKADRIVELRVRRIGSRIRVDADLVNTSTNAIAWTRAFEADSARVHDLPPDIAGGVIAALDVRPATTEHQRRQHVPTAEAQYAYLRGVSVYRRIESRADLERAENNFDAAMRADPLYAAPFVAAALSYSVASGLDSVPPTYAYPRVDSLARLALAIDPGNAEAHAVHGWSMAVLHWDWAGARREIDTALALDPNSSTVHVMNSELLAANAKLDDAAREASLAIRLDPAAGPIYVMAGALEVYRNQPDSAIAILHRLGEIVPRFTFAGFFYSDAFRAKGLLDSALAFDRQAAAMTGHPTGGLVMSLAALGRRDEAVAAYRTLVAASRRQFVAREELAMAAMSIGDRDAAIAWLREAMDMHSDLMLIIRFFPVLQPLRSDPRYHQMLDQMGLPR